MADKITPEQIEALRKALAKATPRPWNAGIYFDPEYPCDIEFRIQGRSSVVVAERVSVEADATLIALARNLLPTLLDEREQMVVMLTEARAAMINALDALESDSDLDQRRRAFEMIQERFEGVPKVEHAEAVTLIPKLLEAIRD